MFRPGERRIRWLHDTLLEAYGPQGWWPGDSRLEVMVGAVLTQATSWTNVERAIDGLKSAGVLHLEGLLALEDESLAGLVRPAGYFNVKARRLKSLLRLVKRQGGVESLAEWNTEQLRHLFLQASGTGPETADDILLYAFERPVFVIDAYSRRLFGRLGWATGSETYDDLREGVELACAGSVPLMQELHALIVRLAKTTCRRRPLCGTCPLHQGCRTGGSV